MKNAQNIYAKTLDTVSKGGFLRNALALARVLHDYEITVVVETSSGLLFYIFIPFS
jgi:hypothetical protein